MTSLRKQVKHLGIGAKKRRRDLDPEDDGFIPQIASDEDLESDASVDEEIGREHYETVGKSKLRGLEKTKLDERKYGGQAVSRDKIFQDVDDEDALAPEEYGDDDPFAAVAQDVSGSEDEDEIEENGELSGQDVDGGDDEDGEIDSDEAFEEGEEENFRSKGFVFRGSGQKLAELPVGSDENEDVMDEDESLDESSASEEERSDVDIDMDDVEGSDQDEDTDPDDVDEDESEEGNDEATARPRPSTIPSVGGTDREKLKALISNDTAALASSLSASLTADAQKGVAVKKQYQTFDRLLDARIKLQKGLTAANDLTLDQPTTDDNINLAVQKAEEAALKLYGTIESLRHSILEHQTESQPSKKRKRPSPPTPSTSTSTLWSRITTLENSTAMHRRQTLDKWSTKTRSAAPLASSTSRLNGTTSTQGLPLTSILDSYLNSETPKHLSASTYSDTHFYQSLLRDLINSRAATSTASTSILPTVPLKLHASGNTSKSRRVDTKASKGRKIRYTVHEKLESFVAAEGRGASVGQWNEGAVREFFGSLLGQRGVLFDENGNENGDDGDGDGGEGREIEALRLFST